MIVRPTPLPGVVIVEGSAFRDERGLLRELLSEAHAAAGLPTFVQDNLLVTVRGAIRGLHLQHPCEQGKLVSTLLGEVFDVALDVRRGSPTFGRWFGARISAARAQQLYLPPGFAHGLQGLSAEPSVVVYKCTAPYAPEHELAIRWDDPALGIEWPLRPPILSERDGAAPCLGEIAPDRLPLMDGAPAASPVIGP